MKKIIALALVCPPLLLACQTTDSGSDDADLFCPNGSRASDWEERNGQRIPICDIEGEGFTSNHLEEVSPAE